MNVVFDLYETTSTSESVVAQFATPNEARVALDACESRHANEATDERPRYRVIRSLPHDMDADEWY